MSDAKGEKVTAPQLSTDTIFYIRQSLRLFLDPSLKELEVFMTNSSFGHSFQIHHVLSSGKKKAISAFYKAKELPAASHFLPSKDVHTGQNFQSTSRD